MGFFLGDEPWRRTVVLEGALRQGRQFFEQDKETKARYYTRGIAKKVLYQCNFDLYSSPAPNWRDTLFYTMALVAEELPPVCRSSRLLLTNLKGNPVVEAATSKLGIPCATRHELERAPTFRELFDRTHKQKETDDYVSESARTIAETYDRTMADRYVEGTPQPDLDPEAWVDAAGGPRKGRVYSFGDNQDTTQVLSSYASSVAPLEYASSSAAPPDSGVEEMRTLIREELLTCFGIMVEQLISTMQGVRPSQPAPQFE
ncbi:hypothetical protein Taro_037999 [Colocasia esculenta]|uniref:Uncharacterized protein n=1 Tax=Colocasia esculenta TaxID=4460 RepID=A0A843W715_COLES|nr:hypothetical protein [Colocasia esculenta]